ncbi:redoxin domain-containing protein [Algoriphagus sp. CAU 1675]|uniref:redoxin domain-containing protein n=1 Tax=Algoriphagus sp. CAU 1675 TaxID=3032597 RepID=UPI0023DA0F48|nr:redoxin domain-containing protein [Algoriphagus sp. CAU 1675]MDF2158395.1 redoxin domain-containing protein [Algoriphagus sp. CAU 1675]
MKSYLLSLIFFLWGSVLTFSQSIPESELVDAVTGKNVTLKEMIGQKGLVLIFHNLNCPFAKMYENRISELRANYQNKGFNFALINPEVGTEPESQLTLRTFIDDSKLNMAYLIDEGQKFTQFFQITKIPEAVILTSDSESLKVSYRGAIDNNPQAAGSVSEKFLERAINQLLKGEDPIPAQVRAPGCNIKRF